MNATVRLPGIFQGESTLLLGRGQGDQDGGLEIDVHAGDVIILPAGTAHCCLESTTNYRYVGVYPKGCPRWRNELGKELPDIVKIKEEISSVAMPAQDPVMGDGGPLMHLWLE
ncbi:hypothetical protein B7463_g9797, partial [Scytalidium lignicola]